MNDRSNNWWTKKWERLRAKREDERVVALTVLAFITSAFPPTWSIVHFFTWTCVGTHKDVNLSRSAKWFFSEYGHLAVTIQLCIGDWFVCFFYNFFCQAFYQVINFSKNLNAKKSILYFAFTETKRIWILGLFSDIFRDLTVFDIFDYAGRHFFLSTNLVACFS